jgi:uncharacterized membrane protein
MTVTTGLIFAFIAAILWGINGVVVKKGLRDIHPFHGTFLTILFSILLFLPLLYFTDSFSISAFTKKSIVFLGLAGVAQYFLGRGFSFSAVKFIGPSRAYSIISMRILLSAFFGVVILEESMSLSLATGTFLVFAGIYFTITDDSGVMNRKGLMFAIFSSFSRGVSPIFIKLGIVGGSILMSNFISLISAAVALSLGTPFYGRIRVDKRSTTYMVVSAFITLMAVISYYYALSITPVTLVAPVTNLSLFITLVASYLTIQKIERVNIKIVIGVILVVAGYYFVVR